MRKLLIFVYILSVLTAWTAGAIADVSAAPDASTYDDDESEKMVAENTALWEQTYGSHELWDYVINAKYASAFGTLADGYNTSWLPVEPPNDALPFEDAVSIAKAALYKQDSRFNEDYFTILTVASSFMVADMPGTYFSQQGTWIIEFWSTLNDTLRKIGYAYVDAHTKAISLMMIAIDQNAPDDYDHILVIENPL
jgi:hypothetical protein